MNPRPLTAALAGAATEAAGGRSGPGGPRNRRILHRFFTGRNAGAGSRLMRHDGALFLEWVSPPLA